MESVFVLRKNVRNGRFKILILVNVLNALENLVRKGIGGLLTNVSVSDLIMDMDMDMGTMGLENLENPEKVTID